MTDKYKKLIVLTGAGMSAESGIETFRDENGRWRKNDWRELACQDAFERDPQRVLDFYNARRSQLSGVNPRMSMTCMNVPEVRMCFTCTAI